MTGATREAEGKVASVSRSRVHDVAYRKERCLSPPVDYSWGGGGLSYIQSSGTVLAGIV